jgi:hypothetical protein
MLQRPWDRLLGPNKKKYIILSLDKYFRNKTESRAFKEAVILFCMTWFMMMMMMIRPLLCI